MIGSLTESLSRALAVTLLAPLLAWPGVPAVAFHFPWDQGHDTFQPDDPPDEDEPEDDDTCETEDPVNLATGHKRLEVTDVQIDAIGPDLSLKRVYHSSTFSNGPFGLGWKTNLSPRALLVTDGVSISVLSCQGNGRRKRFIEQADGSFLPAPGTYETLERRADDSLVLREKDGTERVFDAGGFLRSITDRRGNALTLTYNAAGQLASATDSVGRSLQFTSGADGRIAEVRDPLGRAVGYEYDFAGRLIRVTNAEGGITRYEYGADNRLVRVTDPRGVVIADATYDGEGRVIRERLGDGGLVQISYPVPGETTVVVDERGNSTTYQFNARGNITGFTGPLGESYSATSDGNYNRTGVVDENGNVSQYEYDERGNLVRTLNALGEERRFGYTADFNQLSQIVDPGGATTTLEYDTAGNLVKVTNSTGAFFQMEYDTSGQMTSLVDPNGHATSIEYGPSGQPTRVAGGSDEVTMTYDAVGNLLTRTHANGGVERYEYDGLDRLVSVTSADGGIVRHAYDEVGNLTSTTDAQGNVWTFEYDGRNRKVRTINPLGHSATHAYDPAGNLVSTTDANGNETRFEYDAAGRKVREIRPGSAVHEFQYDSGGNLVAQIMPDGVQVSFTYDALNRVLSRRSPLGQIERYTYDERGNRTLVERLYDGQPVAFQRASAFDGENRVTEIVDGESATTRFTYDALGNVATKTDANGGVAAFTYDPFDQLATMMDAEGGTAGFAYDAIGNVVTVSDPAGSQTGYAYDPVGRKIRETSPDTGATDLAYDLNGNLVAVTDARGVTTALEYDALDRLIARRSGDASEDQTFVYDVGANAVGKLSRIDDESGSTEFGYDARGKQTSVTRTIAGIEYRSETERDTSDKVTRLTYPGGGVVEYGYDADGRVTSIRFEGQVVIDDIRYQPFGPASGWTYGNGLDRTVEFDQRYHVRRVTSGTLYDVETVIDGLGNPVAVNDLLDATRSQRVGYDELQRISTASGGYGDLAYSYDPVGNRLTQTVDGVATQYAYQAGSNLLTQLSGPSSQPFSYDAMGNLVNDGVRTYEYNEAGRLARVADGFAEVASYVYDANGRRARKTVGGVTTVFVYGLGGEMLGEYDGVTGAPLREYIYLGNVPIAVSTGGNLHFVQSDHLGTARQVYDAANVIVWRWDSSPFGDTLANIDPDGDGSVFRFSLRFAGQYYDDETGRHYNHRRDYDPAIGRYIQSDPIGLRGGFNTYVYAGNNPLLFVDPTGEEITGEWIQRPTIAPGWPDRPRFAGFTLGWSWWGYLKLVKVFFKLNGKISASVKCTDKDECGEERRTWELSTSFPASISGTKSFGPNLYAIGLGIITGQIWVSIGANVVLAGGAATHAIIKLRNKYGDIAQVAKGIIEARGPDFICNSGWPAVNLNVTVQNL